MSVGQLRDAGRAVAAPFSIALADASSLHIEHVLRLLPGKRLSGLARWQGRQVFAKIFVAAAAVRHGERERDGCRALAAAGLATPGLLAAEALPAGGYVVISDYLADAEPMSVDADADQLAAAFALLGRLHQAGLVHGDVHPGNFLQAGGRLHLIDGDAVTRGDALANLALFFAQFPVARLLDIDACLAAYGRPVDRSALAQALAAARESRVQRYLEKIFRDCSEFAVTHSFSRFCAVRRDKAALLAPVLADPDSALAGGICLKDGGTCTVGRADGPAGAVVIKRYNLKHWRHALSRAWRPSRAWHSWREAHRLLALGVATPLPLALIEDRRGPLRGRAFYLAEHVAAANLLEVLDPARLPSPEQQAALRELFVVLCDQRITHGDLKATNLLWQDGRVVLIDLDAMCRHRSMPAFQRAWRRDRARLLRNWPADSPLVGWLDSVLPPA